MMADDDGPASGFRFTPVRQAKGKAREQLDFQLKIRQQPRQARMCGVGDKADRRPIDPPPIVQLRVVDRNARHRIEVSGNQSKSDELEDAELDHTHYLQNPYLFMRATLISPEPASEAEDLHLLKDGKTRYTLGSNVSSLFQLRDVDDNESGFFIWPDLSVRVEGEFRLRLDLYEIVGEGLHFCSSIISDIFTVYTPKRFPGSERSTDMSRSFRAQGVKVRIHQGVSTTSPFSTEAILPRRVSGVNKRSQDDESAAASSRAVSPTRSVGSGGGQQDDVRGKRPRTSGSVEQSRPSAATHAVRPTSPLSLLSSQNHSLRRDYPSTADYATRQQAAAFEHYEQSQQQHSHHPVHPAYLMPERRPSTHSGSLPAGSTHAPPSPYHGPSHHRPHPSYPPPYPSHQHPHHAHPYHPSYSQPHLHSSDYPQHFPPKPSEQHTVQADPSVRHEFRNSSVFARSVSHTGGAPSHGVGSRPPYEQSMTSPVGSYPPSGNGGVARKSVVSSATLPPPSRHSPFDQSNRSLDGGPPPLPIAPRHSSRPSSAGFLPSVLGSSSLTSSSSLPPFSHATYYGSHPSSSSSSLAELRTSAEMTDKLPPPYGDDAGLRHHRPGSGGSTFASSSRDSLSSTTSERHSFTSTSADRLSLTSLLSTQSSTPPIPAADHATTARARPEYAVNDRFSLSAMRETDDEDGSSSSRSREVVAAASPMYESSSSRRNSEMGPRDEIRPPAADLRRETPMEGMLASSRSLARMTSSDSRPPLLPPGPEATTTGSAKGKMGLENILS